MLVTACTKKALAGRRQKRDLLKRGYEEITCASGIGRLWELDRGARRGWQIVDAIVGVNGLSVFVKTEDRRAAN